MFEDTSGIFGDYSSTNLLMSELGPASNVNAGANPSYALADFLTDFPQFSAVCTATAPATPTIPTTLSQKFINMANSCTAYGKYGELWSYCMGLYIAHFCTLFLTSTQGQTTGELVEASSATAPITSESVGDVSATYDVNTISDDLKGFGTFKLTIFGQQYATFAKMAGMGGAYVR